MPKHEAPRLRRRKRVRHFDEAGHAHFLTFSCYRRMPLLCKDRSRHERCSGHRENA